MSTARLVPETFGHSGDDPWDVLKRTGRGRLLKDAFMRLRFSDGFSHARSMALMITLVAVQGVIALVGLTRLLGDSAVRNALVSAVRTAAPGPSGRILTQAAAHGSSTGGAHRAVPIVIGSLGAPASATTAMGQLERALNRIYGVEQDRPALRKYGLGFALAVSAGTLVGLSFSAISFSHAIRGSLTPGWRTVWAYARWPIPVLAMTAAMALLLRLCPRRRQPPWRWLAFGGAVSVLLWWAVTLGLALFFRLSSGFGDAYGPLAGMVALMLWAMLASIAVLFGAAVTAQLEAVRAGTVGPQDVLKVERSEPSAA